VSRRRSDYRTWEELTREERRRGLAVLSVAGVAAVVVVFLVVGSGGGSGGGAGAAAPPTTDVKARLTSWYATTAQVRSEVVRAVNAVRADIQAADGMSLKPACADLGRAVDRIGPLGLPPVESVSRNWTEGAGAYAQAVTACGNLFDGTPVPPPVLLQRTTDALNAGDGRWTMIVAQIGAPAQIVPTG
jgi:hypothetical protein